LPGSGIPIYSGDDKNLSQKEPVVAPSLTELATTPDATPESRWRASGEIEVLVYCRPINPRLLLIRMDDGQNNRVAVQPALQPRFGVGKRIWVRPTPKPGFYELAGTYTQWGKRVA
jgi:hypothetical protein